MNEQERWAQEKKEILAALADMYGQYCSEGHSFMSAGELASSVLEEHGVMICDEAGRPTHWIVEGEATVA